ACAVDCAAGAGHGTCETREGQGAVAVVHCVVLPGSGVQYVSARRSWSLWGVVEIREAWTDGDALPDRDRFVAGNSEAGGASSAHSGSPAMAADLGGVARINLPGVDNDLSPKLSARLEPLGLRGARECSRPS